MSVYDRDPVANHPEPSINPLIRRELHRIAGDTDTGMPLLRLVWGQSIEASYFLGTKHLTYRHHLKREAIYFEMGLDGKIAKVYGPGAVLPATKVLGAGVQETDIGMPRWVFEYAQPIDPNEWETERQIQEMQGLPDIGPVPEGAVDYEFLAVVAKHDGFKQEYRGNVLPMCCLQKKYGEGKSCWGTYREPTMRDVEWVRMRWAHMSQKVTNGFRGRATERESIQRLRDRTPTENDKQLQREGWEQEFVQAASHVRKRTASALRGDLVPDADKQTYHCLGVATTSAKDNQARSKFAKHPKD